MTRLALILGIGLLALVLVAPASAVTATRLVATVGPAQNITLTKGGRKVTTLKPGAYAITVRDRSRLHNFALTGPRLRRSTTVSFVGTRTWNVTLRRGKHTFVCTPHASFMRGTFNVR
jgi:plastocyanin